MEVIFYKATDSNIGEIEIDEDEPYEIPIINDLETSTGDQTGYTGQEVDTSTLMLFQIYFMGVISGLIFMTIMWRRIR